MKQGVAEPAFQGTAPLDLLDHGRVVPDAGVEAEVPPVHLAETNRSEISGVDPACEELDSLEWIVRQTERACEHVGGAARKHAERSVGARNASGNLVERAVAAVADHHVNATSGGVVGKTCRVAASVGLDDLDIVALAQSAVDDDGVACGHRRRERIHDQENFHRSNHHQGRPRYPAYVCGRRHRADRGRARRAAPSWRG